MKKQYNTVDFNGKETQNKNTLFAQVKSLPIFSKSDLLVYLALALLIVLLFCFLIFPNIANKKDNLGFTVCHGQTQILIFNAENSNPFTLTTEFDGQIEISADNDLYSVKIYSSPQKTGYNVLLFNQSEISVKVIESTCSASKDCIHFPTLKNNGSIYCAPHNLKIQPINGAKKTPPITG